MSAASISESVVEQAALAWLEGTSWRIAHGPDIAPGAPGEERADYGAVVLEQRLRDALARLNPELPVDALNDAFRKLTRPEGSTLESRNRAFHRLLVDGRERRVPHQRRHDPRTRRPPSSTMTTPLPTTSSRSTRSPSPSASTPAARTSCCSSTACRSA